MLGGYEISTILYSDSFEGPDFSVYPLTIKRGETLWGLIGTRK